MSWKAEVQADSTGQWYANARRFATREACEAYAKELAWRWTAVRDWRAAECDDAVTEGL